jgi:hexosaminidase
LYSTYPSGSIYYTDNGTNPNRQSTLFNKKIAVDQSISLRAALFENSQQSGKIFTKKFYVNSATGRNISLTNPPHAEYSKGGASSLVDGYTGDLPWLPSEWLGFSGKDLEAVIDLDERKNVSRISVDVLKDEAGKIFLPKQVVVKYSDDGENYKIAASIDSTEIKQMNRRLVLSFPPIRTRWIKVFAENSNGRDWLFADEIMIE